MKLVVCDVGGVLCGNTDVAPAIAAFLHMTEEAFYAAAGAHNWEALLGGELTESAFWDSFSRRLGRSVPADLWGVFFDPSLDEKMACLLRELRRSFRVVAGTNTFVSHYATIESRGWYETFDAVYASHEMRTAKPSPDFYGHILRAERVEPCDAYFIDDAAENVAGALAVGLEACLYKDVPSLRCELKRRGLIRRTGPDEP